MLIGVGLGLSWLLTNVLEGDISEVRMQDPA